jgi:hypothetical protein
MQKFSKRAAFKAAAKAAMAMPFLGGFLSATKANAALSEADANFIKRFNTLTWRGRLHMKYKGNYSNNYFDKDCNLLIEDMTCTVGDDLRFTGGLMMRSRDDDAVPKVLTWARFSFDGYILDSAGRSLFIIEHMELVPNYSRTKTYDFAGEETERMDLSAENSGYGWPRCFGTMVIGTAEDGKALEMWSLDFERGGKVSMQQFGMYNNVTMNVESET